MHKLLYALVPLIQLGLQIRAAQLLQPVPPREDAGAVALAQLEVVAVGEDLEIRGGGGHGVCRRAFSQRTRASDCPRHISMSKY
jgi:hypothetical protein